MIRRAILLLLALAVSAGAPAKTLRWSSQGDASTVDPHAQNESFTNAITLHTQADYVVEPYEDAANKNTPPKLRSRTSPNSA